MFDLSWLLLLLLLLRCACASLCMVAPPIPQAMFEPEGVKHTERLFFAGGACSVRGSNDNSEQQHLGGVHNSITTGAKAAQMILEKAAILCKAQAQSW
jgi:hypothetical protein